MLFRSAGCALLVVSEELEELFEISDRLLVIAKGRVSPSVATSSATIPMIGEWMSGLWGRDGPHPNPLPKGEGAGLPPLPLGEGAGLPPLPLGEGWGEGNAGGQHAQA